MSASAVIVFLVTEFVLGICILLAFYGIDWIGAEGTLNKLVKALVAVVLGAVMLLKLLAFAGAT